MCGIVGIYAYQPRSAPVDLAEVKRISDAMLLRGPDGEGFWNSERRDVAFGHRRLAIIDISDAGAQPMIDEANDLVITFNGEIYNFWELRADLEKRGYRFRSKCDTEVLLAAYAIHGPEMVHHLVGMFAFAIWDGRNKRLFLARDPFGIKPLYYSNSGGVFRFASQVKALKAGGVVGRGESPAGHVGFYLWGHVPDPYTLYDDIKSLPAGCTMIVDDHGVHTPKNYWSLKDVFCNASRQTIEFADETAREEYLSEGLRASIQGHLVSDVPLGVFLSAGRDSATILGLAQEVSTPELYTFTLGFEEYKETSDDEVVLAEMLAEDFVTRHNTSWVSKNDFADDFERILSAMDQPSSDGINVYMVSREGRRAGIKVALTGIGGDELFGGYPSFRQVPALTHAVQRFPFAAVMGSQARKLLTPVFQRVSSPKYAGVLEYGLTYASAYLLRRALFMPWEIETMLGEKLTSAGLQELDVERVLLDSVGGAQSAHATIIALEMNWYMRDRLLRDADWASMAHSLEIRVPFVNHKLLEHLAPVLCGPRPYTKSDMAMTPHRQLPDSFLRRPKTGFSVPVRDWLLQHDEGTLQSERGLRSWAKVVYARQTNQTA